LDWLAHINYVKAIASKRVNIMKFVSNVRWEADQDSLLIARRKVRKIVRIYRIRMKIL
jgi:hypothetical protein